MFCLESTDLSFQMVHHDILRKSTRIMAPTPLPTCVLSARVLPPPCRLSAAELRANCVLAAALLHIVPRGTALSGDNAPRGASSVRFPAGKRGFRSMLKVYHYTLILVHLISN